MMKRVVCRAICGVAAVFFAGGAWAAARSAAEGLYGYAAVSLSAAGDAIAYVETVNPSAEIGQNAHGRIVVRAAKGGLLLGSYDPCLTCRYDGLVWSPDGRALAFIASDQASHTATLDVLEGGKIATLAVVTGVAQTPRWSPDGVTIALLATPGAHKESGSVEAGAAQVGDIETLEDADEQRIAVIPAAGGALRYVSPTNTFVYEYDWTPDGRGFVATAALGNGDANWWVAKLEAIDLASGQVRIIAAPTVQMNAPRVSPDGRSVRFIGGLMSDFGQIGGDIFTVPYAGGEPVDVTPGFAGSFSSLVQRRSGLFGTALLGERTAVVRLDPDHHVVSIVRSAPTTLTAGEDRIAVSADGRRAATVEQDFAHPPHILAGPIANPTPVTHDNDALEPLVKARSITWTSDGLTVQGWLLGPTDAPEPGRRYPMVVVIHGGPGSAVTPTYRPPYSSAVAIPELIRRGYYVFQPNPRGSFGQGEAFTRANVRDFGGGDLRDIVAGIDAVQKIAPIDATRLGVLGHSYGGFMSMWAVTHSSRFRAAVAGAGVANWLSYYGENGITQWLIPFLGASAYDDPDLYRKLSPIAAIKGTTTPTLVYVGERDLECPPGQSFEFWRGLRALGVPTSLMIYAGQGHAIHDPEALQDLRRREVEWFERYLGH